MAFSFPLLRPHGCKQPYKQPWFGKNLGRVRLHNHLQLLWESKRKTISRITNITNRQEVSETERFCERCAGRMEERIPPGDERVRSVCTKCHTVAYENPKVVVGCVPISEDGKRVLLVKRAIPPIGKWTLPAGFLEVDETAEVGAAREALEEAGARMAMRPFILLAVYDILPAKQIQLLYRSTVLNEDSIAPGVETQQVKMFEWSEIPWDELAFPTVQWALEYSIETLRDPTIVPQMKSR